MLLPTADPLSNRRDCAHPRQVEAYGSKFDVETIFGRIEDFVASFAKHLEDMPDSVFDDHCRSLIALKLKPFDNMYNHSISLWSYIQGVFSGGPNVWPGRGCIVSTFFHLLFPSSPRFPKSEHLPSIGPVKRRLSWKA